MHGDRVQSDQHLLRAINSHNLTISKSNQACIQN
jgi:hypothetical protein